jgi:hypothetical protein
MSPSNTPRVPIFLRLRALRRRLAVTEPRFRQEAMSAALGYDKSRIAKYESPDPKDPTIPQRHIKYEYVEEFADYVARIEGKPVSDVDLINRATEAYNAEVSEDADRKRAADLIRKQADEVRRQAEDLAKRAASVANSKDIGKLLEKVDGLQRTAHQIAGTPAASPSPRTTPPRPRRRS